MQESNLRRYDLRSYALTTKQISRLVFGVGHSVHTLQLTSLSVPAGNSENPDRRMFIAKLGETALPSILVTRGGIKPPTPAL